MKYFVISSGRSEIVTFSGRSEFVNLSGRSELITLSGRSDFVILSGRSEIVTLSGRSILSFRPDEVKSSLCPDEVSLSLCPDEVKLSLCPDEVSLMSRRHCSGDVFQRDWSDTHWKCQAVSRCGRHLQSNVFRTSGHTQTLPMSFGPILPDYTSGNLISGPLQTFRYTWMDLCLFLWNPPPEEIVQTNVGWPMSSGSQSGSLCGPGSGMHSYPLKPHGCISTGLTDQMTFSAHLPRLPP